MKARANGGKRAEHPVLDAVRAGGLARERVVLAVSGGVDSMVLLDAALRVCRGAVAAVATFDHGTGRAATVACDLVEETARFAGAAVVRARAEGPGATEAAWRAARWRFLRRVSAEIGARVVTAHTRDDQVETVFIRALRGAGARGLAGLYAPSPVLRPLLDVGRPAVASYAAKFGVRFVDDPSNASRAHLRNRVRLDLLPALERAHPGFSGELLALARRAAEWRASVERLVDELGPSSQGTGVFVDASRLAAHGEAALGVMWPALAARAGITLDRRGIARLASFSRRSVAGGRVQLSGGHEVVRHARAFEIRVAPG